MNDFVALDNTIPENLSAQLANMLLPDTNPYPFRQFPPVIRNVIRSLHDNTQIPVELISNVVLATISLTCQSLIEVIQPHTNMPEPCSLYLMAVAEPGEGKTTINRLVMKPCYEFAAELIRQFEEQNISYRRELKLWKVRQQALENNYRQAIKKNYSGKDEEQAIILNLRNEPSRPPRLNFIYEDTSLKALVEGLSEHPEAGIISDEAITFFNSYLKNHPGLLNKAWDGEPFDFRRADKEIYQLTPNLTFSLMSQPEIFLNYIMKHNISARSSGFLSRFLFAWVKSSVGMRQNTQLATETEYDLTVFHKRITELLTQNKMRLSSTGTKKKTLKLSAEALTTWQKYRTQTEKKIVPYGEWEHIKDIVLKAGANTLRIAALLHYFDNDSAEEIDEAAVTCASGLMNWYLTQAHKIFYPMSERYQFEQDVRELYSWLTERINDNNGFAILKNDLKQYGPNHLRRTDKLTPVLNQLIAEGQVCVFRMSTSRALYISFWGQNGPLSFPCEFIPGARCDVVQSQFNTIGRPYVITRF